jgi:hypothetical protein
VRLSTASTQTAPSSVVCNATQTAGRPFPSDTGTQTEIQGIFSGHIGVETSAEAPSNGSRVYQGRGSHERADTPHEGQRELDEQADCECSMPVIPPAPRGAQHAPKTSSQSSVPSTCQGFDTDAQLGLNEEPSPLLQNSDPQCGQVPESDREGDQSGHSCQVSSLAQQNSQAHAGTEDIAAYFNKNHEDGEYSGDDSDSLSLRSLDSEGGTTFLPSTQTPSSQQSCADSKRYALTPPVSLSISHGNRDVGVIRKRLRSSSCQTQS